MCDVSLVRLPVVGITHDRIDIGRILIHTQSLYANNDHDADAIDYGGESPQL